ncbi:hypothetical protein [Priestia megaterium]|uniref:hypothetical protein n=1 Tax=Priestia megaterium TaxID=1404 RepID=UPI0011282227|nr:hypothetical protein [Priestia megaterium]TPF17943.1 hypothetical protein CBE78_01595 [Priestia megaterium]TPF22051.1 hypothetical protein CBE79_04100 [Priestia megaterium]
MSITIKENQKQCVCCGSVKSAKTNFYQSTSEWHEDSLVPYCKNCLKKKLDESNEKSVHRILSKLDRPYISEAWEKAIESNKDTLGVYLSSLNIPKYKGKDYFDGEMYREVSKIIEPEDEFKEPNPHEFAVSDELYNKWGFGYQPEEYRLFERKYKKLEKSYNEKTALHTENLLTYIRYRVKEEMAAARGDTKDAKEWGQLASKAAQDGKINVSQLSKSDISGGVDVLSQLFDAVETEVGILPLLPQVMEQPYDDADLIIWAIINYYRRLEDKPQVAYRDIWNFYDEMLGEHFETQGFDEDQIEEYKATRNNVFRDLEKVYKEPLYEGED